MRSSDAAPTALDRYFRRVFGDDEPSNLGSGWVGGVGSVLGGALGLFGVLCLHFPRLLTAPVLRAYYPIALLRGVLQAVLIASVMLGLFSVARRRRKVLGLTGIFLAVCAMALGGAAVPLPDTVETKFGLGLEWFALIRAAQAHLGFPSTQIDRTIVHGWFLLFAPRARKCVSDGTPSARWSRSQPLHPVWTGRGASWLQTRRDGSNLVTRAKMAGWLR